MTRAQIFQVRQYMERLAHEYRSASELASHAALIFKLESELKKPQSPIWKLADTYMKRARP
jgi:hypothetical protein